MTPVVNPARRDAPADQEIKMNVNHHNPMDFFCAKPKIGDSGQSARLGSFGKTNVRWNWLSAFNPLWVLFSRKYTALPHSYHGACSIRRPAAWREEQ